MNKLQGATLLEHSWKDDRGKEDECIIMKVISQDRKMMRMIATEKVIKNEGSGTTNKRRTRHTRKMMVRHADRINYEKFNRNIPTVHYGGKYDGHRRREDLKGRKITPQTVKKKDSGYWRQGRRRAKAEFQIHQYIRTRKERSGHSTGVSDNKTEKGYQHIMSEEVDVRGIKCDQISTRTSYFIRTNVLVLQGINRKNRINKPAEEHKTTTRGTQRTQIRKTGECQGNQAQELFSDQMATRSFSRKVEARLIRDENPDDKKGKTVVGEEVPTEIFEVPDNSDEEEDMKDRVTR